MMRYGLLGRTLAHSFSKSWFAAKFAAESLGDCLYENFELPFIDSLPALLKSLPDLRGLNVTIPYKEAVLPYLTRENLIVQAVGASNCIRIIKGELHGYNTDVIGFEKALLPLLRPNHCEALVLGAGGAAKAVRYALVRMGIKSTMVSRKLKPGCITYNDLHEGVIARNSIIINTTPVGMHPNIGEAPPLNYNLITPGHLLFDLTYNPALTKFLAEGAKRGAATENGYRMLVFQAEESWRIWNDMNAG